MIGDVLTASFPDLESASGPCPPTPDAIDARRGSDGYGYSSSLTLRALRWARAGDRQALDYLYARYADDVYEYVRTIVGNDHEAERVTRQVFARMIDSIGGYEERDVPFRAWILRVSRTVALDHVRRGRQASSQHLASRIVTI
jgi:sugar/nucleoside kinase (ribokinase family)